jgi:hypothetical protein
LFPEFFERIEKVAPDNFQRRRQSCPDARTSKIKIIADTFSGAAPFVA